MYDQFASDYDRFINWQNRLNFEIPLIEKIIHQAKLSDGETLKVLDSACGTGMHALALAKTGIEVVGADLSTEMIDKARDNAQNADLKVRFEAAGFGSLASVFGENKFNAILCLGNSLPHILEENQLRMALIDFLNCLRPGGILLIQNRNFDAVMEKQDRWMEPQAYQDGDDHWVFHRFYDFHPDGTIQFNMVTLHRNDQSEWTTKVASTLLKPQLQQDLLKEVKTAGFHRFCTFGNLKGDVFDPHISENLILIARKQ